MLRRLRLSRSQRKIAAPIRRRPRATPTPTPALPPADRPPWLEDLESAMPDASASSESPVSVASALEVHEDSKAEVVDSSVADEVVEAASVVETLRVVVDEISEDVAGDVGYDFGSVAVPVGSQYCLQMPQ
jgi:hypothetical protein